MSSPEAMVPSAVPSLERYGLALRTRRRSWAMAPSITALS